MSFINHSIILVSVYPGRGDELLYSWLSNKILLLTVVIDGADAETLKEGENATFINWGNLMIKKVNKNTATGKVTSVEAESNLQDQNFKKTLKITWLGQVEGKPEAEFTPTVCVYYDHIISKPVLDKDDDFKNYIGKDTQVKTIT